MVSKSNIVKILILFAALFFLFVVSHFWGRPRALSLDGADLRIETAAAPGEISKGLGGRNSLEPDRGMLFIFPASARYDFWMKDMKFSIDIIWLKGDRVVDIAKNILPEPGVADANLKSYRSKQDADRILEVNAGFSDNQGVKIGDKAVYSYW